MHADHTQMATIAVVIDEVLAALVRSLAALHNAEYGTQLSEASFHRWECCDGIKMMRT